MPRNRIRKLLTELRAELEQARQLGGDTRERLDALLKDVGETIDETTDAAESGAERLRERVEDAASRFDEEHPRVAAALREVLDGFNRLGI